MAEHEKEFQEKAVRALSNFCLTYSKRDINDLTPRLFGALIGAGYPELSIRERERLLDYFEALEEVSGVLHDVQEFIRDKNLA